MMMTRQDICAYAAKKYQTCPDNPWRKYPHYTVLRHKRHGKWYGLLMDVPRCKLNMEGADKIDILNLKTENGIKMLLPQRSKGILPAYHMNKEHWISIALDGSVDDAEICFLLDASYRLTQ